MGGHVDVLGAKLWVDEEGVGTPVVLLHGFTLDGRMWDDIVPALAEHHRVVRVDLRGFGRSSLPDAPYSLVDDVAALLEVLDAVPAHVVGLSMGGGVALGVGAAHPHVVRSVVSIDGTCGGFRGHKDYVRPVQVAREQGLEAARALWANDELFHPARRDPRVMERLRPQLETYSGFHWTHRDPGHWFVADGCARLADITAPTLAMVGALDHPDFLDVARLIVARVPDVQYVVLDDVGHLPPLEAPARTAAALLGFLGSVDAR